MMPAPEGFTADLDTPSTGSRTVTLRWKPIPQLPPHLLTRDVTGYQYSQNSGTWQTTNNSTNPTFSKSGLTNGISYAFRVKGVRGSEVPGLPSRTITVRPLKDAPGSPGTLNVERVENTATLTWSPPTSDTEEDDITRYEYSDDGGSTWQSTASTSTTYTVTGFEAGETYIFLVRAVYIDGGTSQIISHRSRFSNAEVLSLPRPKRRIIQDCPVGWVRSDACAFSRQKECRWHMGESEETIILKSLNPANPDSDNFPTADC